MESMFHWDGWASIDAPLVSSLFVILVLMLLGTVVGIRARIALKNKEYLQKPKGIMFFAELYYDMCNNFAGSNMGENHIGWGGYFWTLFAYLFLAFNISLFGLPSLVDWLACPLCLAIIMFTIKDCTFFSESHVEPSNPMWVASWFFMTMTHRFRRSGSHPGKESLPFQRTVLLRQSATVLRRSPLRTAASSIPVRSKSVPSPQPTKDALRHTRNS